MTCPRRDALRRLGLLGAGALVGAVTPEAVLSSLAALERPGSSGPIQGIDPFDPLDRVERTDRVDRIERVGLQLHTMRDRMAEDFEGTLRDVARIGYREVEFAGYHGRSAENVRTALVGAGLEAPAAHVSFRTMMSDWERAIVAAHVIGHRYLVVGSIPSNRRQTLGDYRRAAALFNRAAATARVAGMGFAYHNHAFELEPMEGRVPYDVLLEETDPELVHMELDLYWMRRGRRDPLEYIQRHPGRFRLLHVKDMGADGEMTPVGEGTTDFGAILARGDEAGFRHFFVEHDDAADALASARTSYAYLRDLRF